MDIPKEIYIAYFKAVLSNNPMFKHFKDNILNDDLLSDIALYRIKILPADLSQEEFYHYYFMNKVMSIVESHKPTFLVDLVKTESFYSRQLSEFGVNEKSKSDMFSFILYYYVKKIGVPIKLFISSTWKNCFFWNSILTVKSMAKVLSWYLNKKELNIVSEKTLNNLIYKIYDDKHIENQHLQIIDLKESLINAQNMDDIEETILCPYCEKNKKNLMCKGCSSVMCCDNCTEKYVCCDKYIKLFY